MQIAKLEPSKHKKGRFLVHLEDGSLLRVGEREIVNFSLYRGMELDEETRTQLEHAAQQSQLRDRGLNLLANRPMSRKELMGKLRDKEATPAEAEDVADWLEHLGMLNDEQYAKILVEHYARKGYGTYKIKDELYRRGVPKELWEDALGEAPAPDDAIDRFIQQKLRGEIPDRPQLKKVSDALARRGFSWSDIREALARYTADLPDE